MKMRCHKARKNISLAMDDRLGPSDRQALREHLQACPACRAWEREQSRLAARLRTVPEIRPGPGFYAALRGRLDLSPARRPPSVFTSIWFRPALLRAALLLLLVLSTALGFFLGGRLEAPAAEPDASAFSRAMNLDAFADLPAGSFGAVYDRLLQGEIQ
jgi:predicted anti-sigma-YlaC factor YlaD